MLDATRQLVRDNPIASIAIAGFSAAIVGLTSYGAFKRRRFAELDAATDEMVEEQLKVGAIAY